MCQVIAVIAVVAIIAGQAAAYTAIFLPSELNGKCYDQETQSLYEVGTENARPGFCERIYCYKDFSMVIHGCGTIAAGPGCEVVAGDLNKPYPFCCDQVKCTASLEDNVWEDNRI